MSCLEMGMNANRPHFLFHRRAFVAALLMVLCAAPGPLGAAPLPAPKPLDPQALLCARPIATVEKEMKIPGQLLAAVAVAESGRWLGPDRAVFAWPWTVTSGPKSWHFADRDEAVTHVRALKARGIRNIDVGCMQINLAYHGRAFASLDDAFDPDINVAYAAKFLTKIHATRRSWSLAVGHYHSATPALQNRYRRKVMALWNKERRRVAEVHRLEVIARFEAGRRARLAQQAAWRNGAPVTNVAAASPPASMRDGETPATSR